MNINQARFLRWVLVETSHPGNVGSAARAIKTMGFEQADAIAMASGAVDILESCSVSDSLDTTVQGCSMVVGLTSREREFWSSCYRLGECLPADRANGPKSRARRPWYLVQSEPVLKTTTYRSALIVSGWTLTPITPRSI